MKRSPAICIVLSFAMIRVTGCAGASGTTEATPTPDDTYGTRTVIDCLGTESTLTAAPTRVATVTTSVLDFLLTLGLEESIVGVQAVAPGAFPPDLQAIADTFPKLGGEYVPGNFVPVQREELLQADPDFVIGGWPSNFDSTSGALSQAELAERGIPSYFAFAAACARSAPVTDLSIVYTDIENYGKIFALADSANALVSDMEMVVENVQEKVADREKPKVFSYSWEDGGGNAYAVGNQHLGNAIITLAGGQNIFDDVDAVYGGAGWEEVVDRNPDVIIIEVFGKATQEQFDEVVSEAIVFFTEDPAMQSITAVRNKAFVPILAETYYVGGVRNAEAVELLARAFHPDAFDE